MRRLFTVLTAAFVALSFGSVVFGQAAATEKKPAEAKAAAKTAEKTAANVEQPATGKKAGPLTATGKVVKIDEATKVFIVTTKQGDKAFTLAGDTKIMAGAKEAKAADLAGRNVKVTYTTVEGRNVASRVTVAAEAKPAAAAEKKAEKK
jgi:hypothetical protein